MKVHGARANSALSALLLTLLLGACAPAAGVGSSSPLPLNDGRRVDLVIDEVRNPTGYGQGLYALTQSVWSASEALRSWFTMVDRVTDASNTVLMTVSLDAAHWSNAGSVSLPFLGNQQLVRGEATATVALIDPISGIFLSSATATRSEVDTNRDSALNAAVRGAVADAFHRAASAYAGH